MMLIREIPLLEGGFYFDSDMKSRSTCRTTKFIEGRTLIRGNTLVYFLDLTFSDKLFFET